MIISINKTNNDQKTNRYAFTKCIRLYTELKLFKSLYVKRFHINCMPIGIVKNDVERLCKLLNIQLKTL